MNKPYNILMLSGDVNTVQGQESVFYEMLGEFSQYFDRVDIICPGEGPTKIKQIHDNVYFHPINYGMMKYLVGVWNNADRLISSHHHQMIISHDYGLMIHGVVAGRLSRKHQVPWVSEIHHLEGYPVSADFKERLLRLWGTFYLKTMTGSARAIRVVNQEMRLELLNQGVEEKKLNLVSSQFIDRQLLNHKPKKKNIDILFVGRLEINKGIFTILDAVATLKELGIIPRVVLVGNGSLKTNVQERIIKLRLKNVELMEPLVSRAKLFDLYRRSKVLVCASTSEGGPRVTIEAMACDAVVITTSVGVMPEIIEQGKNGYLFRGEEELVERLKQVFGDEQLRKKVARNGKDTIKGMTREKVVGNYARFFLELIESQN